MSVSVSHILVENDELVHSFANIVLQWASSISRSIRQAPAFHWYEWGISKQNETWNKCNPTRVVNTTL